MLPVSGQLSVACPSCSCTVQRPRAPALQAAPGSHSDKPVRLASIHRQHTSRRRSIAARAERSSGGGFLTGFVVGGAVFGALGFLFAPQISAALLSEDQRLKLPRFLEEEEKDPEATKQDLADKIAQLNSAIDDVSAQLKAQDNGASTETAAASAATVPS